MGLGRPGLGLGLGLMLGLAVGVAGTVTVSIVALELLVPSVVELAVALAIVWCWEVKARHARSMVCRRSCGLTLNAVLIASVRPRQLGAFALALATPLASLLAVAMLLALRNCCKTRKCIVAQVPLVLAVLLPDVELAKMKPLIGWIRPWHSRNGLPP